MATSVITPTPETVDPKEQSARIAAQLIAMLDAGGVQSDYEPQPDGSVKFQVSLGAETAAFYYRAIKGVPQGPTYHQFLDEYREKYRGAAQE